MQKEEAISNYFQAWIGKDTDILKHIFSENIVYSECYGPEYHGMEQILKWFADWNKSGKVIEWTIKRFIHQGNLLVTEWFFKCEYNCDISSFDGVTIAEFDENSKIVSLREFQSKAEHWYPYEQL